MPEAREPQKDKSITVAIDPGLKSEPDHEVKALFWTAYGFGLAGGTLDDKEAPSIQNRYPGMRIELSGRRIIAALAKEKQEKGERVLPYAENLAALLEANLLVEYVLSSFSKEGWYVPGRDVAEVDFSRYAAWMAEHIPNHVVETRAGLFRENRPLHFPGPGGWADADEFALRSPEDCAEKVEVFLAGVSRWAEESASLDAVPVAAGRRADFVRILSHLRSSEAATTKGVLWVDPSVTLIHFLAGYCAIDTGRYEEAVEPLRAAVALDPLQSISHSELAVALGYTKRYKEALDVVETGLQFTDDSCEVASLLRRRGWTYIETGDLPLARIAYLQSLELDPTSDSARHQLGVIDGLAGEYGQSLESPNPPPYTPPPSAPPLRGRPCR